MPHSTTYRLHIAVCALMLAACQQVDFGDTTVPPDDTETADDNAARVTLTVKTPDGTVLPKPLALYAIASDGHATALSVKAGKGTTTLAAGYYNAVALAGCTPATDNPTASATAVAPDGGTAPHHILHDCQPFAVGTEAVSVPLVARPITAAVDVLLNDVPLSATAVQVSLVGLYTAMTLDGHYTGSGTATIPCHQVAKGTWASDTVCTLPSCGSKVRMTIDITTDASTRASSYEYRELLQPAASYHLRGRFTGTVSRPTFTLTCTVAPGAWGTAVDEHFTFGSEHTTPLLPAVPPGGTPMPYAVDHLPSQTPCPIDGHALIAYDSDTHEGLFLSLHCYEGLTAQADIGALATAYSEAGLTEWAVPTYDQAESICRVLRKEATFFAVMDMMAALGDTQYAADCKKVDKQYPIFLAGAADSKYRLGSMTCGPLLDEERTASNLHLRLVKPVILQQR